MEYRKYRRLVNKLFGAAGEAESEQLSIRFIERLYARIDRLESKYPAYAARYHRNDPENNIPVDCRHEERRQMGLTAL